MRQQRTVLSTSAGESTAAGPGECSHPKEFQATFDEAYRKIRYLDDYEEARVELERLATRYCRRKDSDDDDDEVMKGFSPTTRSRSGVNCPYEIYYWIGVCHFKVRSFEAAQTALKLALNLSRSQQWVPLAERHKQYTAGTTRNAADQSSPAATLRRRGGGVTESSGNETLPSILDEVDAMLEKYTAAEGLSPGLINSTTGVNSTMVGEPDTSPIAKVRESCCGTVSTPLQRSSFADTEGEEHREEEEDELRRLSLLNYRGAEISTEKMVSMLRSCHRALAHRRNKAEADDEDGGHNNTATTSATGIVAEGSAQSILRPPMTTRHQSGSTTGGSASIRLDGDSISPARRGSPGVSPPAVGVGCRHGLVPERSSAQTTSPRTSPPPTRASPPRRSGSAEGKMHRTFPSPVAAVRPARFCFEAAAKGVDTTATGTVGARGHPTNGWNTFSTPLPQHKPQQPPLPLGRGANTDKPAKNTTSLWVWGSFSVLLSVAVSIITIALLLAFFTNSIGSGTTGNGKASAEAVENIRRLQQTAAVSEARIKELEEQLHRQQRRLHEMEVDLGASQKASDIGSYCHPIGMFVLQWFRGLPLW